jgi:lipopolysaccharide transport protein LptA
VLSVEAHGLTVYARQATVGDNGEGSARSVRADAPGLQISSDHSQWRFSEQTAIFTGHVRVTRGDTLLTCQTLTVSLGDGEQIRDAVASGSVVVSQAGRRAEADQAVLDGATGRVVLTGSPALQQARRTLAGERIIIWLDDEKVDCQQCTLTLNGDAIGGG